MNLHAVILTILTFLLSITATPLPTTSKLVPNVDVTFCWQAGPQTCTKITEPNGVCQYTYGLFDGLKGIQLEKWQFCIFYPDEDCKDQKYFISGPTDDFNKNGIGLDFFIRSVFCYDPTFA